MKRIAGLFCAALAALWISGADAYGSAGTAAATDAVEAAKPPKQAEDDPYYLKGAVPVVDGQVLFSRVYDLPGMSTEQIFGLVKEWLAKSQQQDKEIIINRNIVREAPEKGQIYQQSEEYLVLIDKGLSLDRAKISYIQSFLCSPGKCETQISRLRYLYENEVRNPEGWITDDYAVDKANTKLTPGVKKMRVKTVDMKDGLFNGLADVFRDAQLATMNAATKRAEAAASAASAEAASAPVHTAVVAAPEAIASAALIAALPEAAPAKTSAAVTQSAALLAGYKRIAPDRIPGNIIKMLIDNSMLLTAGGSAQFDMTTAGWGGLGVLLDKPVTFCYVESAGEVGKLMEAGTTYTLSFYTEAYRDALQHCSGAGTSAAKLAAAGLTPMATPSGAETFSEAWMVIECRKTAVLPVTSESIADAAEKATRAAMPLGKVFVGEILNVWVK